MSDVDNTAEFNRRFIICAEGGAAACKFSTTGFPEVMIRSLVQAIRLGSVEARGRFPRLLQLVENDSKTAKVLMHEVCNTDTFLQSVSL